MYRLWVVWNHSKAVVMLPLCAVFGLIGEPQSCRLYYIPISTTTATGSGIIIEFHDYKLGQDPYGGYISKTSKTLYMYALTRLQVAYLRPALR